jgi:hypothetical protein
VVIPLDLQNNKLEQYVMLKERYMYDYIKRYIE